MLGMTGLGLSALLLELALHFFPVAAVEMLRRGPARDNLRYFEYDASLGWQGRPSAEGASPAGSSAPWSR
jgi:hypothetical protein